MKTQTAKKLGFVYFITTEKGDITKIGVASAPVDRLRQLQTGSPFKLKLVGSIETNYPYVLEKKFHNAYDVYRTNGEWFDIPEGMASEIIASFYKGLYNDSFNGIIQSMNVFREAAFKMVRSDRKEQDPAKFYSYQDVETFDESIKKFSKNANDEGGKYVELMAKTMQQKLYLLLQANAWGDAEVNMQETARDIIGFHNLFTSFMTVKAQSL